ncbi:MAG: CoF synthetase [Pseudomonadota bacterium]
MIPLLEGPVSFATTRWLSRPGFDRGRFQEAQHRALDHWLANALPHARAFHGHPPRLRALPEMDKATLMADFAGYNIHGITAEDVHAAMARDFRIGDLTVGASTGTSGNRGLFVISDAERFRWLGSILAKTIGDLLWRRQRVAIILPQGTGLYDSANRFRQIHLQFYDLTDGPEAWRSALEAFAPTVIVAPPKVLRHLAEACFRLSPVRVFSAAETLDPVDRPVIEAAFGAPLRQIYMATEGLLGVSCRHGRLHLAEESMHFEHEPVGEGLVSPLVSSFRRRTQILARYRMNDLLRLDPEPCPCGSPLQAVSEVVGRMDDCFHLTGRAGVELVTPDILRNAVLRADTRIADFRIIQSDQRTIDLALPPDLDDSAAEAALAGLRHLLTRRGVCADVALSRAPLPLNVKRKLRRVRREWKNPTDKEPAWASSRN